jgi:hypothetical protein
MRRTTTGLRFDFFSVTISTGQDRTGKSTDNFNPLSRATERAHGRVAVRLGATYPSRPVRIIAGTSKRFSRGVLQELCQSGLWRYRKSLWSEAHAKRKCLRIQSNGI